MLKYKKIILQIKLIDSFFLHLFLNSNQTITHFDDSSKELKTMILRYLIIIILKLAILFLFNY